jgi:hypothetical protein
MPAGGICPQCRSEIRPAARFCGQCGVGVVAQKAAYAWGFAKVVAAVFAIIAIIVVMGAGFYEFVGPIAQVTSSAAPSAANSQAATDAQRYAMEHRNDPWWDAGQPDGFRVSYYGAEYVLGPGEWVPIDVQSPAWSARYRYVVEMDGISRFRARPDGYREMEFVYPNAQGMQPYQLYRTCRMLLVQPLDNRVYHVRVKYVRVPRAAGEVGFASQ